jgi:hypothetical protein
MVMTAIPSSTSVRTVSAMTYSLRCLGPRRSR